MTRQPSVLCDAPVPHCGEDHFTEAAMKGVHVEAKRSRQRARGDISTRIWRSSVSKTGSCWRGSALARRGGESGDQLRTTELSFASTEPMQPVHAVMWINRPKAQLKNLWALKSFYKLSNKTVYLFPHCKNSDSSNSPPPRAPSLQLYAKSEAVTSGVIFYNTLPAVSPHEIYSYTCTYTPIYVYMY